MTYDEAVKRWRTVLGNMHDLQTQLLEIAKHPEVAPAELLDAHKAYQRMHTQAIKLQEALQTQHKPTGHERSPFTFGD